MLNYNIPIQRNKLVKLLKPIDKIPKLFERSKKKVEVYLQCLKMNK